jgi:ATP-dependent Lon protease
VFDESAIASLIRDYTLESGVRNLTREVGAIVRYLVAKVVGDSDSDAETEASKFESMSKAVTTVDKVLVAEILGPAKYEEDSRARLSRVGVSTGLAYNGTGGGAVLYIEATQMEGKGKVQITGSVADVMQESVHTAISWIRSNAKLCQVSV